MYGFAGHCVSGASRGSISLSLKAPPLFLWPSVFAVAVHCCQIRPVVFDQSDDSRPFRQGRPYIGYVLISRIRWTRPGRGSETRGPGLDSLERLGNAVQPSRFDFFEPPGKPSIAIGSDGLCGV